MDYKTIINSVTGEVTTVEWSQKEIEDRRARLLPHTIEMLRQTRNNLLDESDIYVLPDRWDSYDAATKEAWATYRQELRDLPANTTDPYNPVWPTKPQ